MKNTITPGGATLAYLEAGDALQENDFCEEFYGILVFNARTDALWKGRSIGHVLTADEVAQSTPRRYTPAE